MTYNTGLHRGEESPSMRTVTTLLTALLIAGCGDTGSPTDQAAGAAAEERPSAASFEEEFRLALETARPGDVIEVPAGTETYMPYSSQ